KLKDASQYELLNEDIGYIPYAIVVPLGATGLRLAVNRALSHIYDSDVIAEIFRGTFGPNAKPSPALVIMYRLTTYPEQCSDDRRSPPPEWFYKPAIGPEGGLGGGIVSVAVPSRSRYRVAERRRERAGAHGYVCPSGQAGHRSNVARQDPEGQGR